jgi:hypothetical protein
VICEEARWPTSSGDEKVANYMKNKFDEYLDGGWFVNYEIMMNDPVDDETFVRVIKYKFLAEGRTFQKNIKLILFNKTLSTKYLKALDLII